MGGGVCGTLKRLDPTLLVDTHHNSMIGRIEIEPRNIGNLLDEKRIAG